MHVSVSDAKAQLTELARRAEAGEEVILTRRGRPVVKLAPIAGAADRDGRRRALRRFRGALKGHPDFADATAVDADAFLYDDRGLPA